ncbi:MAG: Crp/Fnr family transcriptional regulator [Ruminococcaceae bacterium]|nr:Crp/Fnr family transcriptional regulator [Oscillospiraceae bacterium]
MLKKIKNHPIFMGVPQSHIEKYFCEKNLTVRTYVQGETAYSSVTKNPQVALMVDGVARVYAKASNDGEGTALLRTLRSGDLFGIANLYAQDDPFPSKIVAAGEVKILFMDGDIFKKFIETDPTALKNYLEMQSKKIVYLNKKISTFTAGSAEKKLIMFMLDHIDKDVFTVPCSMTELSDMLGIGRASLYRAIDSLTEDGILLKQNKNTFKVDLNKIKNI